MLTAVEIIERCFLMAEAQSIAIAHNDKIGKVIYRFWTREQADPSEPDKYELTDNIQEWATEFLLDETVVKDLVYEIANIIVQYESLLNQVITSS